MEPTAVVLPADLPDPLRFDDGSPVATPEDWQTKRRPEIFRAFETLVYGRAPFEKPDGLSFVVESRTPGVLNGRATRHQVVLVVPTPSGAFRAAFTVFVPTAAAALPCPALVFINNREKSHSDPDQIHPSPFWPIHQIIARGYAAAAFHVEAFDPDDANGYARGIRGAYAPAPTPESWGAIASWGWGASRVLDYLETLPEIDNKRVGVVGHSRGGKAALWCGARDERFALTVSNCSGCTGAALARSKSGETIAAINTRFPHWFCENYKQFNNRESDFPVDQHELLALIAPRLLYVASATNDVWADPASEWAACVAAAPVFERVGKGGVGSGPMPTPDSPRHTGSMGYHLRTGVHDLTLWDWEQFMDFADANKTLSEKSHLPKSGM